MDMWPAIRIPYMVNHKKTPIIDVKFLWKPTHKCHTFEDAQRTGESRLILATQSICTQFSDCNSQASNLPEPQFYLNLKYFISCPLDPKHCY